jgi:hypothetical protein
MSRRALPACDPSCNKTLVYDHFAKTVCPAPTAQAIYDWSNGCAGPAG